MSAPTNAPTPEAPRPSRASWVLVVVAWILVGVPLLWGVYTTLQKAAVLLR
ncbi:MAG TPA: hypothetical protein VNK43_01230 [Gemmatimonadales bacterium]|nr:hypothetical protein [Gemmatimonadales bacterium]